MNAWLPWFNSPSGAPCSSIWSDPISANYYWHKRTGGLSYIDAPCFSLATFSLSIYQTGTFISSETFWPGGKKVECGYAGNELSSYIAPSDLGTGNCLTVTQATNGTYPYVTRPSGYGTCINIWQALMDGYWSESISFDLWGYQVNYSYCDPAGTWVQNCTMSAQWGPPTVTINSYPTMSAIPCCPGPCSYLSSSLYKFGTFTVSADGSITGVWYP